MFPLTCRSLFQFQTVFPTVVTLAPRYPASALAILYSVAIFCICAAVSASSTRLSTNALLAAFVFLFTSLSRIEYLVFSCSFTRCDLVSLIFFFVSFFFDCFRGVCFYPFFLPDFFCTLGVSYLFRLAPG